MFSKGVGGYYEEMVVGYQDCYYRSISSEFCNTHS